MSKHEKARSAATALQGRIGVQCAAEQHPDTPNQRPYPDAPASHVEGGAA